MGTLPVSFCLLGIRLLFAWLAWKLLRLFDLLRRLPMSHGDLLLVQCQSMGVQYSLGTPTPLTALDWRFWYLHTGWEGIKCFILCMILRTMRKSSIFSIYSMISNAMQCLMTMMFYYKLLLSLQREHKIAIAQGYATFQNNQIKIQVV